MDNPSRSEPITIRLQDYREPDFLIEHTRLSFQLNPDRTIVRSVLACRRRGHHKHPLVLDGEELELIRVVLNGIPLTSDRYELSERQLILHDLGEQFELEIENAISPSNNTSLSGLYLSGGNFCTQCEAEGFRRITYYLDRPDVLSTFAVVIEADRKAYPVMLSNGNLEEHSLLDGGLHRTVWSDPHPKPSYLFALVAGDLAHIKGDFTTMNGRQVDLYIYTQHHNIDKCDHAMLALKKAMAWDEEVYGRAYDLDRYMIVAVDDFNMGAMENKGLNIFNSKYVLAKPETATDMDYEHIEGVIGHEYFHNWSGNRVTCRDWFQLSLKEGFTVFRDQEFSADMGSRGVKRIHDVEILRTHQFKEDAGPMAHPVRPHSYQEINNFYTLTVYNKGAEVVRMIRNLIGSEGFRDGTDLYFSRHDGEAVTTDDFVAAMEEANHIDLSQFRLWYDQAGTPELVITEHHDPDSGRYTLEISQHTPPTPEQSKKSPFHIPVSLALFSQSGERIPFDGGGDTTTVLQLREHQHHFHFEHDKKPIPSLLRGFSAPVKLKIERPQHEWFTLMVNDDDPFSRWDAWQQVATGLMLEFVRDGLDLAEIEVSAGFHDAFQSILTSHEPDRAFHAEMLKLPSESYISDRVDVVDPELIHQVRRGMIRILAKVHETSFQALYESNRIHEPYRPDAEQIGRRALRNLCLGYFVTLPEHQPLVLAHFEQANNMTDRIAALTALTHYQCPGAAQALDQFHGKWQNDALVMDKWLSVQATEPGPQALERIKSLAGQKVFDIHNPNKIRALIGSFAHANPTGFHREDGAGYELVADYVLEVDKLNPQVAARLVSAFNLWRRYDEQRQANMRKHMERIASDRSLSRDVEEIVSKSLA